MSEGCEIILLIVYNIMKFDKLKIAVVVVCCIVIALAAIYLGGVFGTSDETGSGTNAGSGYSVAPTNTSTTEPTTQNIIGSGSSSDMHETPTPTYILSNDKNRIGANMNINGSAFGHYVNDPYECAAICDTVVDCKGFVETASNKRCYWKSDMSGLIQGNGENSYIKPS